jgi:hypothetical protein
VVLLRKIFPQKSYLNSAVYRNVMEKRMDEKVNFFKWVLVEQIQDLTVSAKSMRDCILQIDPDNTTNETIWFIRMCSMSMLASLAKLWEALDHYNFQIHKFPEPTRSNLIKLKAEIETRKIYAYRSKYGAHLIDKSTGNPISLADGTALYNKIVGSTLEDHLNFCEWVFPESFPNNNFSVMQCVVEAHGHCMKVVGSGKRP